MVDSVPQTRIFKLIDNRVAFLISAVVFKLLLEVSYIDFVIPVYEYVGYTLNINDTKYLESWIIFLAFCCFLPVRIERATDFLIAYLMFAFFCPLLVEFSLADKPRVPVYLVALSTILILGFRSGQSIRFPLVRHGPRIALLIIYGGIVIVTAWFIASGGLRYFNLNLDAVYQFRRAVGELLDQGLMGYLNSWAIKVFGAAALTLSLWKSRYFLSFLIVVLHIFWFGVSSQKTVLFHPVLVIFVWLWFRYSKALALLPIGMSILIGISYLLYLENEELLVVGSLTINRVFFVPADLTFVYYEFFSKNQFVFWSNSLTSSFIDYPYTISEPARVIGAYLGGEAHANNTFLATGYMHAGLAGVVVYGALVGMIFRLIDSLSNEGIPSWVAISMIIVPAQALLTSADLPTAILTHGLGISVVLIFLLRERRQTV